MRRDPRPRGAPASGGLRGWALTPARPPLRPQILFDGVRVSQGFSRDGVSVSVAASTSMRVDIPAIGASVTFDGQAFQIRLSYSRFGNNTEGQCGERVAPAAGPRPELPLPRQPGSRPCGPRAAGWGRPAPP